jgi:hypothetical protein
MPRQYVTHHPNMFNQYTAITDTDSNTAVVSALAGHNIYITDIVVETSAAGDFTLTDDSGTALLGPISLGAAGTPFVANFTTPLRNSTKGDQVEFDKTGGTDDWEVYIAGYYEA